MVDRNVGAGMFAFLTVCSSTFYGASNLFSAHESVVGRTYFSGSLKLNVYVNLVFQLIS